MRGSQPSSSHLATPVPRQCWEDRCWRWSVSPKDCKWKNLPLLQFLKPWVPTCSSAIITPCLFPPSFSLNPGPPPKSPGPKWAVSYRPSAHLSSTTRGPFALWTCQSQTPEITAAPAGTHSARCTTPSTSRSKVCLWWAAQNPIRPFAHHVATESLLLPVSSFSLHLIIDLCTDANRAACSVINSPAFCCALFYFQLLHIGSVALQGTLF